MIVNIKDPSKYAAVSTKIVSREVVSEPNVVNSTKSKVFVLIPLLCFKNNKRNKHIYNCKIKMYSCVCSFRNK